MMYRYLTDDKGRLKQNILINKEKIDIVTYIDNLRICDVFDKNGEWEGYNIFFVKYVNDHKITGKIKINYTPTKLNKKDFSCFCKGYIDLNDLEKIVKHDFVR